MLHMYQIQNLIRLFSASVLIEQTFYVFGGLVTNGDDCYSSDTLIFILNSTCGHIPVLKIKGIKIILLIAMICIFVI